jgi:hypothetical protein
MLLFRRDRAAARAVEWMKARYIAPLLRILAGVTVFIIPLFQAFRVVESAWWIVPVVVGFAIALPLQHYHRGSMLGVLVSQIRWANASLSGAIVELGGRIVRSPERRLGESSSRELCKDVLQRVQELTCRVLDVQQSPRLRATLAVPVRDANTSAVVGLRVWCYDDTHLDRHYTFLPLHDAAGEMVPGSPAAFLTGAIQTILDVRALPTGDNPPREYRSIVSIPLTAKGPDGFPMAVVNIDCSADGLFTADLVTERILPFVNPAVTLLGLILQLRQETPYAFPTG